MPLGEAVDMVERVYYILPVGVVAEKVERTRPEMQSALSAGHYRRLTAAFRAFDAGDKTA